MTITPDWVPIQTGPDGNPVHVPEGGEAAHAKRQLRAAFRWHMQTAVYRRAWYDYPEGKATYCLQLARADIAAGKSRYPAPIRGHAMRAGFDADKPGSVYVEKPESFGLRLVGRVAAEPGGRHGYFSNDGGWYDNPHGESFKDGGGLIYGLVYQLRGCGGQARFVAAYQDGANQSCALIDFSKVYASDREDSYWVRHGDKDDIAPLRAAARAADDMAKSAAETEREYNTAWQAGSRWAHHHEEAATIRAEILGILKERRAVKGAPGYPALCRAIRDRVASLLADLQARRQKMATLAAGDHSVLGFWTGDKALQDAFCDGAELEAFPG
jgi:hypothetical protein